jgi:hypothetical protein
MLPAFACNLIATLPYPPWKKEQDWGLLTTQAWEKRVPFHTFVRHRSFATYTHGQVSLFPQFKKLPTEIQLRVLALCPAHTLFKLMHVSSMLRTEASKLFWANPDIAFLVDAIWLMEGGYPSFSNSDLSFLQQVQKVEIDCHPATVNRICHTENKRVTQRGAITSFWKSVTQRLPNVRKIVLNQYWQSPPWWEHKAVMYPLRVLLKARPPGIEVAILVQERIDSVDIDNLASHTKKWQRSLYHPATGGGWIRCHKRRHDTTILIPNKQFNGPIGEYHRLGHDHERLWSQRFALWPLMIEALDRHHFDYGRNIPFTCPMSGCDAYMARSGEWMAHAVDSHCFHWSTRDFIPLLPDELRAIFEERVKSIEEMLDKIYQQYKKIEVDWNEQDKQKRREIQRSWMDQLKNDVAWDTGKKAGESRLWTEFWQRMCVPNRMAPLPPGQLPLQRKDVSLSEYNIGL